MPARRLLPLLPVMALLALPAAAGAQLSVFANEFGVKVSSGTSAANHVTIDADEQGRLTVRDAGDEPMVAAGECTLAAPGLAVCGPLASYPRVDVVLGPGDDVLHGSTQEPAIPRWVEGREGYDTITGGRGDDRLDGGEENDVLDGGLGLDLIDGGGNPWSRDTVRYALDRTEGVSFTLPDPGSTTSGNGADGENDALTSVERAQGTPFGDRIEGSSTWNVLEGLGGDDTLIGKGDDDDVRGGDGDDDLRARSADGTDVYDGGPGRDVVSYTDGGAVDVNLPAPGTTSRGNGEIARGEQDELTAIESATGSGKADELYGNEDTNVLVGYGGDDLLAGGGGDDNLDGGDGADDLSGGEGDDRLFARDYAADAAIDCGEGSDGLEADNALEITPRPEGCETIAPMPVSRPVVAGTARAGSTLTLADVAMTGDAPTSTSVLWRSCAVVEGADPYDDCEQRATTPTLTLGAADLGRRLYAEVDYENAGGRGSGDTELTAIVLPALPKVEEKPVVEQKPVVGQGREEQPPAITPPVDQPVVPTVPRAIEPPADPALALAQRLLGAKPSTVGSLGALRVFGAGRALALVCTKGVCKAAVTVGRKRRTVKLSAGKGAVVRGAARARVTIAAGGRKLSRTLPAR